MNGGMERAQRLTQVRGGRWQRVYIFSIVYLSFVSGDEG